MQVRKLSETLNYVSFTTKIINIFKSLIKNVSVRVKIKGERYMSAEGSSVKGSSQQSSTSFPKVMIRNELTLLIVEEVFFLGGVGFLLCWFQQFIDSLRCSFELICAMHMRIIHPRATSEFFLMFGF